MKGYLAILKIKIKTLFQYRAAAFAGISTQMFWGIINVMVFRAFYSQTSSPEPLSLSQTITFIWLGQALLQLTPWSNDKETETQVKSGNIAYELIRPLNLYSLFFVRSFAIRVAPTLLRCLPVFLLGRLFLGLEAPVSGAAGSAFVLSVIFASFLSTAMTTLVSISLFWTLSGEGIQRLVPHCAVLLSGMVVPLPLFPNWMQPFLNIQPFRGVIDVPCRLYTGVIPVAETFYYLGFQLVWICAFVLLGQWLIQKAIRQFVIQGG